MSEDEDSIRVRVLKGKPIKNEFVEERARQWNLSVPYATIPKSGEGVFEVIQQKVENNDFTEEEALMYMGLSRDFADQIMNSSDLPRGVILAALNSGDVDFVSLGIDALDNTNVNLPSKLLVKLYDDAIGGVIRGNSRPAVIDTGEDEDEDEDEDDDEDEDEDDDDREEQLQLVGNLLFGRGIRNSLIDDEDAICQIIGETIQHYKTGKLSAKDIGVVIYGYKQAQIPKSCACDVAKEMVVLPHQTYDTTLTLSGELDDKCICEISRIGSKKTVSINYPRLPESCGCEIAKDILNNGAENSRSGLATSVLPKDCVDIYDELAKDKSYGVRGNLARNNNIPDDKRCAILKRLAKDSTKHVKDTVFAVIQNEHNKPCAKEVFQEAIKSRDTDDIPRVAKAIHALSKEDACAIVNSIADKDVGYFKTFLENFDMDDEDSIDKACLCKATKKLFANIDNSYEKDDMFDSFSVVDVGEECFKEIMGETIDKIETGYLHNMMDRATVGLKPEDECEMVSKILDRALTIKSAGSVEDIYMVLDKFDTNNWDSYKAPRNCRDHIYERVEKLLPKIARDYPDEKKSIETEGSYAYWRKNKGKVK